MTEGSLRLSFSGFVIDEQTGERAAVRFSYRVGDDQSSAMVLEAKGRRSGHQLGHTRAAGMRVLHARCFGKGSGGDRINPPEPINIDRTPCTRRFLNRWWVRRDDPEASAAD